MLMMCTPFSKELPFKKILFHGLVLDKYGKKMSKTKGNGVDPSIIIKKYGADNLRYYLVSASKISSDLIFSEEQIKKGERLKIKVQNVFNLIKIFIKSQKECSQEYASSDHIEKNIWVANRKLTLDKFNKLEKELKRNTEYDLHLRIKKIKNFFRNFFCSRYLEMIKIYKSLEKQNTEFTQLLFLFTISLLHPFLPFLTEEIYQQFKKEGTIKLLEKDSLLITSRNLIKKTLQRIVKENIQKTPKKKIKEIIDVIETCWQIEKEVQRPRAKGKELEILLLDKNSDQKIWKNALKPEEIKYANFVLKKKNIKLISMSSNSLIEQMFFSKTIFTKNKPKTIVFLSKKTKLGRINHKIQNEKEEKN